MSVGVEAERNEALVAWYATLGDRDFPWRGERDPYRVLVSEVMLQQTQAPRVVEPYLRFLERFPTVEALAEASLGEVLEAWSGLGYNLRARRLRDAARRIVAEGWPTTAEGLRSLPGLGPYTAAAVACFAFGERVPAVDTNLRRVLSRWHGTPLSGSALRATAEACLGDDAAIWNQAMMALGASVCRPHRPRCGECPVADWCSGPDGYEPPRPQPRFEGSFRQLRGAIVRAVVTGPQTVEALRRITGFAVEDVVDAVEDLREEGLVERTPEGAYRIAD